MLSIEIDMGCDEEMNSIPKLIISLSFFICITSACLAPRESSPVNNYDLGKAKQTGIKLNISTIDQNGPYNNKMIFRVTPENIQINEFERWTQSPDLILYSFLKRSFIPGGELALEGDILSFENDLTSGKAIFTFHYKITRKGLVIHEGIFNGEQESDESPAKFASAMARLANDFVSHISNKINPK